jgi:hypothetical protein
MKCKAMKSSPLLGPFCGSEFWGFSLLIRRGLDYIALMKCTRPKSYTLDYGAMCLLDYK